MGNLTFGEMLTLIEDRSAALRHAATDLTARVPGCPDWSVGDLVTHLAQVQLSWAAVVAAGPASGPPGEDQLDRRPGPDLLAWSADQTARLVASLGEAGPDRPCWTWWAESGAPMTSGAVARHQVQEAGVHAFDAQEAAGQVQPLPAAVAADGIGEFLTVGLASEGPWPHEPARLVLAAAGGPAWAVSLGEAGARAEPAPGEAGADAVLRGSASDLVLWLYNRHTAQEVVVEGDRKVVDQLLDWIEND
jgi:uncharacterized protein (TIGR03083 family)